MNLRQCILAVVCGLAVAGPISAQNFGIGVLNPTQKLDVVGRARVRDLTPATLPPNRVLMSDADGVLIESANFTGQPANSVLLWNGASFAPGLVPGDNWGTQTAATAGPLVGNGTAATPLNWANGTANGNIWQWTGANWVQTGGGAINGQVLTWNGTNWVAQNLPAGADNWGSQVAQVTAPLSGDGTAGNPLAIAPGAANGQVLTWNGAAWVPQAVPSSADNWGTQTAQVTAPLSGNGTAATPLAIAPGAANGQVLTWNGAAWVPQAVPSSADNWGTQTAVANAPLAGNGTAASPLTWANGTTNGNMWQWDGSDWVQTAGGAAAGQVMTWNGTNWVPQNAPLGADDWGTQTAVTSAPMQGNGTAASPITFQPGTAAGQVWEWDGTNWVLAVPTGGGSGITQINAGTGLTGTNLTGPTATLNVIAENGLTAVADAVRLGGTLIQNTNIAQAGFNLTATGVGNIGFGTAAPTERMHLVGNFRLDGALMPGNNAGNAGQYLRSNGPGVAPTWGMNAGGINAIERYVIPPINLAPNTTINYTVTGVPNLLPNHSVMINLYGEWGTAPNVRINHIEARTGEIRFAIFNQTLGTTYNGMDFILTVIR